MNFRRLKKIHTPLYSVKQTVMEAKDYGVAVFVISDHSIVIKFSISFKRGEVNVGLKKKNIAFVGKLVGTKMCLRIPEVLR